MKAIRWASDRIGKEGIVAYVCNNSFVDDMAFDGVRKHLARDFDALYVLNLGGNVRKNPKLSGTTHNVFGIQVGVCVNFFVRGGKHAQRPGRIYYQAVPVDWRRTEKYRFLEEKKQISGVEWEDIQPDKKHTWLTEGLRADFEGFLPLGNKLTKGQSGNVVFRNFGNGIKTNRDDWAWNFSNEQLATNIQATMAVYNEHVERWQKRKVKPANLDAFVDNDASKISWSETLKKTIEEGVELVFEEKQVRRGIYRPFTEEFLYFDKDLNERRYQMPVFFPRAETEKENRCLWIKVGSEIPFWTLAVNRIPDLMPSGGTQCFPFYTYDGEGGARRENIPHSTLVRFQNHYGDEKITKWDIFHYTYAVLHHPEYRTRYAANLRRELPRIPLIGSQASSLTGQTGVPPVGKRAARRGRPSSVTDGTSVFHTYAAIGKQLADLHVHYEQAAEHPLQRIENPEEKLNWRVEKMRLTKDKTALTYNGFLTLAGIPEAAFAYRLGNRSALEWVIDQYQTSTDPRSGITNDPNREDEPDYIVKLIGKVITVSLETQKLIAGLPPLQTEEAAPKT